MAGRGRTKEVALQVEVESQEDWEEVIGKEGLTVVDVYQEWCGPCKAMTSTFKRIKNESGDDMLRFAMAKCDSIESLERYRGKCEPCFLFYASGALVAVVRGANCPLLTTSITEQLAYEHKVLEGTAERKEIHDPRFPHTEEKKQTAGPGTMMDESESESESEDEEDESRDGMMIGGERVNFLGLPQSAYTTKVVLDKLCTVAIVYPDVVADDKMDLILEKLKMVGIDVLENTERELTVDEAKQLLESHSAEENFDEVCEFLTSGPSHILVLTKGEFGEGIVEEWLEIIGPEPVSEAVENVPNSYRALYGHPDIPLSTAFHGSKTLTEAKKEMKLLFPEFVAPKISLTHLKPLRQPRTLALIRPDALEQHKDEILAKISEAGFKITMQKDIQLTKEQAAKFYQGHESQQYFEELVNRMTIGPVLALVLEKEDAVELWRSLLGPKEVEVAQIEAPESLRAQFAMPDVTVINQLHGSDNDENAEKEIAYFFPMEQTLAVIKPDAYDNKEKIMLKIREAGFQIVAQKDMQMTKDLASNLYKKCEDKDYFGDLTQFMSSGPASFLILSKQGAVTNWKECIGPTDPEAAREETTPTLRAQFGKDILENAIHGPSDESSAKAEMELIFGDLEFDEYGNVKKKKKEKKVKEGDTGCEDSEGANEDTLSRKAAEDGEEEQDGDGDAAAGDGDMQPDDGAEDGEKQMEDEGMEDGPKPDTAATDGDAEEQPDDGKDDDAAEAEGEMETTEAEQEGEEDAKVDENEDDDEETQGRESAGERETDERLQQQDDDKTSQNEQQLTDEITETTQGKGVEEESAEETQEKQTDEDKLEEPEKHDVEEDAGKEDTKSNVGQEGMAEEHKEEEGVVEVEKVEAEGVEKPDEAGTEDVGKVEEQKVEEEAEEQNEDIKPDESGPTSDAPTGGEEESPRPAEEEKEEEEEAPKDNTNNSSTNAEADTVERPGSAGKLESESPRKTSDDETTLQMDSPQKTAEDDEGTDKNETANKDDDAA